MIARVKFPYPAGEKFAAVAKDPARLADLRAILGHLVPADENLEKNYYWPDEALIDLDVDGPALVAMGATFEVVSFKGTLPLTALLPER